MPLSCFDNKIYIQNNGYDGLVHGYYRLLSLQKSSYLNNYSEKSFCQAIILILFLIMTAFC